MDEDLLSEELSDLRHRIGALEYKLEEREQAEREAASEPEPSPMGGKKIERSPQEVVNAILVNLEMVYRFSIDKSESLASQGRFVKSMIEAAKAESFLDCIKLIKSESQI